jgi:predicted RecB family nuclease
VKHITGTSVYSYVKCPRLAELDLHLDRRERRAPTPWEEFAARRGREFEARFVAPLGARQPVYPERDFAAGAAATLDLLHGGVPLVHQAVLQRDNRLGLPDLLRRVDGRSELGDHHYEVVDVKTSARARSDQILQVAFYSCLLGDVQGRRPEHGALVLKDGSEDRFVLADYLAVVAEVEQELHLLRQGGDRARPFLQAGCETCHWNHRCLPELEAASDLSLVQGMSRGARAILESVGCRTVEDLATFRAEGARARGNLDATLLRRLRRGAHARLLGKPLPEPRPRTKPLDGAAIVHLLADPYADRVLAFASLWPARPDGTVVYALPRDRADEWPAFRGLLAQVPEAAELLHFGEALPRWYDEQAHAHEAALGCAVRFLDLARRLHGAAVYPGPVFGLAGYVRHGLQRDPWRAGHPGAAAMWLAEPGGEERLRQKLRTDLLDLAELKAAFLDVVTPADGGEEATGSG